MSDQNKYKNLKTNLTPEHWKQFEFLDDDIKDKILNNFSIDYYESRKNNYPNLFFLHHIFKWSTSLEGDMFWINIFEYYQKKIRKGYFI